MILADMAAAFTERNGFNSCNSCSSVVCGACSWPHSRRAHLDCPCRLSGEELTKCGWVEGRLLTRSGPTCPQLVSSIALTARRKVLISESHKRGPLMEGACDVGSSSRRWLRWLRYRH